ncbi:MAG: aspartyl/asparaginyl beta-hydroxylase domain-containing protein [Deltaproteobacteria bacterium]|jgi:hypothetical protein|nr:aspartyl/asparaginyl beta-hydroxylase domain-containing protein [Deltaproteobacteria bacterium]
MTYYLRQMAIDRQKVIGSTVGTWPEVAHYYAPQTTWPKCDQLYLKLPEIYQLPSDLLADLATKVISEELFEPIIIDSKTGKRRRTYRGVGLTFRPGAEDPTHDAAKYYGSDGRFDSTAVGPTVKGERGYSIESTDVDRDFSATNDVAPGLVKVIRSLFKSPVTKIRLFELLPSGVVASHVDLPYYQQIRLHTVLATNDDVSWEVEGQRFQIPADGRLHWFDTGRMHSVYNFGSTSRIVLSIHLNPYDRPDLIGCCRPIDQIIQEAGL